jgi:hypothetical protein
MLLIFDTKGGLCNQFYDIMNGINFCLKYNIFFTFRYCSFRNEDLKSWTNQCYGHSYSSFSHMINNIKDQNNFYNL